MKAAPPSPFSLYYYYFFIFLIQTLVAFSLYFTYSNFSFTSPHCKDYENTSKSQSNFIVLLWTWPFGHQFPLNKCPRLFDTSPCFFTANRNFYNVANAIIFHHREVCTSRSQVPQIPRPEGQYWVWFNLESPSNSPKLFLMNNLINLTMSYRMDSDIFTPYGWMERKKDMADYKIPNKTGLVAWVVSNWKPYTKRVIFYKVLKKHIPIDVYGKQHLPLARERTRTVLSRYKFYLSFENSEHTDYITEKLWNNAFDPGCVPVVLGPPRENYERFIPPDSFIHVDDFPNAMELAAYLLELDKDNEKYQQYFKWRSKLYPVKKGNYATLFCKACAALQKAPPYRTVPDLEKWFT